MRHRFWHWLGWLDRDLAGVVTDMAITEIPILSVLIGAVVVSIWLGFRGANFDYFPQASSASRLVWPLGNHIRRRLREGRCGASLFRVGTLELARQKPWLFTAASHCSRVM